ncbi:ATP synthase F1 subcomplex epsilon subunit [Breoghania corrubedonensis]|uniref:ATP synthase epsilon chain n=1 Tax=Breoghania corrubedonensis TaxID=665038 RepID=A0A2T5VGW0_9HYPH|nr:F0F1 ATP synthase subunit epsilon [Breoghania corrubedonensis]PTW62979.1 ATP synthase F1 subcomplex epsilon subunit [Breoghania corrubedonensis]
MAEPFQFELVSPERLLISEAVNEVVVPGTDGDFGVLKDHAPTMSTVRPGFISVKHTDGHESRLYVVGGFADVNPNGLTILAEEAIDVADIKAEDLAEQIRNAEEDFADAKDDDQRLAAATKLDNLKNMKGALANL